MRTTPITTGEATYCPEDNKLRLYTGRVPREEYLALKADGWKPLYKQREAGGGDFVATWTPNRYATALAYGEGIVLDEDMSPQDRAADRAERFSGYRDKRLDEATGHADRYDSQPAAHGYQSQAKAERAAARHDRIGDRAVDAWDKAEYWQRRTAGVIAHALYKSTAGLRMGRINELESLLRKAEASLAEYGKLFRDVQKIAAISDPEEQTTIARKYFGSVHVWAEYMHPRIETVTNPRLKEHPTSLHTLLSMVQYGYGSNDITGAEACALFFSNHGEPRTENAWTRHYQLRLAYERQMLEQQGGRLEQKEMEIGGRLGGKLIVKLNRSAVTKRIKSVVVLGPRVNGYAYRTANIPGTDFAGYQIETERLSPETYTAPDDASLKALEEYKAKIKAHNGGKETIPLINPTDKDAERLQTLWNEHARADIDAKNKRHGYTAIEFKPSEVIRTTQAIYSARSKGTYAAASTRGVFAGGIMQELYYGAAEKMRAKYGREICLVRQTSGGNYQAHCVIVLTDKPQKALPDAVWKASTAQSEEVPA